MSMPATLQRFLASQTGAHELLDHPPAADAQEAAAAAYLPLSRLAQAICLRDRRGPLVAVYPANCSFDLDALNRQLARELRAAAAEEHRRLFHDCAPGIVPALSGPYGVKAIVDERLSQELYFRVSDTTLVRMRKRDLVRIQSAWRGADLARPDADADETPPAGAERMRRRVRAVSQLPPMPEMGQRVLQLRGNPYAGIADLVPVVEMDPSLAAQVIHYARSPFFGYRGDVDSVRDAISRVLGYEMTLNIVLGLAVGRGFSYSARGPLGLDAFWRHSVYCAATVQLLAKNLPAHLRPKSGLAYLAGLLHNFGLLLLGHLFQPEFYWLNKQVELAPDRPLVEIERELLGITHMQLGTWLMEQWSLPAELLIAVGHHHDPEYAGVHGVYPHLVLTANHLLKRLGMGDAESTDLPSGVLQALQLSDEQAEQTLTMVLHSGAGLDTMARQLAA